MQVRRLVRNYLWGGTDGTRYTCARVRWSTIILPRGSGGLDIIDPKIQIRAFLSKLIVWGLFPGKEPWKKFYLDAIQSTISRRGTKDGHVWTKGVHYIFSQAPLAIINRSPFMHALLRIWRSMRPLLIHRAPRCIKEIER